MKPKCNFGQRNWWPNKARIASRTRNNTFGWSQIAANSDSVVLNCNCQLLNCFPSYSTIFFVILANEFLIFAYLFIFSLKVEYSTVFIELWRKNGLWHQSRNFWVTNWISRIYRVTRKRVWKVGSGDVLVYF